MKIVLSLLLTLLFLNANVDDKLVIDSDKFESDDSKGLIVFTNNVKMTRAKDKLNANKVTVYLNTPKNKEEKREAIKYIAEGNVSFDVDTQDRHYIGSGNKVIYLPKEMKYQIIGNGYLKDLTTDKTLIGENIFIDQKTGNAKVEGSADKPVRFIFEVEDKK